MGGERLAVVTAIALVAIVGFGQEAPEGGAAVIMAVLLDEENLVVRGHLSLEDDHVRRIDGHDLDLVAGQRGLKQRQFGISQGPSGTPAKRWSSLASRSCLGLPFFNVLYPTGGNTRARSSAHGDEGAGTAQGIAVLDPDDGPFEEASGGRRPRFVTFAVATAWTRGADEGRFHVKGVVGGEGLVRIEFLSQGLKVGGQPVPVLSEFAHAEGGGLEGVVERPRLHGEVQRGVGRQGGVRVDLA